MTYITMQNSCQCCQRLIAARMLPGRHGELVHVQVHVDLATLRNMPGASDLETAWSAARAPTAPPPQPAPMAAPCTATAHPAKRHNAAHHLRT